MMWFENGLNLVYFIKLNIVGMYNL
jgi:hypothetical protein